MKQRIVGRRAARACALVVALFAMAAPLRAQITIPPGAALRVDGGRIDFGGSSYAGRGALRLGAGQLDRLDDFRVLAGGSADLGSGVVRLTGDWENRGTVIPGSATVEFIDGLADSEIIGTSTFSTLRIVTAMGKRIRFESGQTQHVAANLVLIGNGAPLRIEATSPPVVAYLDLPPSAAQNISNVAVSDVYGAGQLLAPGQVNQGGNGNAQGWFGTVTFAPRLEVIPAASSWSLLLFALLITLVLAWRSDLRARLSSGEIA